MNIEKGQLVFLQYFPIQYQLTCRKKYKVHFLEKILIAYNQENPLSIEEKQSIFYVLCSIQMICVTYFSENEDKHFKHLAKINRNILEFIINNEECLTNLFIKL